MVVRLGLVVALLVAASVTANELCQRLVVRGQVAWTAGRVSDAEDLFAAAVSADPNDPDAHYGLGVALARQGRWTEAEKTLQRVLVLRPGDPLARRALERVKARTTEGAATVVTAAVVSSGRPWSVRGRAAAGYDSNVGLLSHGTGGRRGDSVFQLGAGLSVTAIARPRLRLELDYDFDQTLHPRLQAYNLRTNRMAGTLSVALYDRLWASLYGGVEHYSLGSHQYLLDPFVEPLLSYEWQTVGVSQLFYRHGEPDYLSRPFKSVRSGQTNSAGIHQTVFLGATTRWLSAGYTYDDEAPRRRAGDDYQRGSHDVSLGLHLPVGWQTIVDLAYSYRRDDYRQPNSVATNGKQRTDDAHLYGIGLERPLGDRVTLRLNYEGTANRSNIGFFDYRRNLVVLGIETKY